MSDIDNDLARRLLRELREEFRRRRAVLRARVGALSSLGFLEMPVT